MIAMAFEYEDIILSGFGGCATANLYTDDGLTIKLKIIGESVEVELALSEDSALELSEAICAAVRIGKRNPNGSDDL